MLYSRICLSHIPQIEDTASVVEKKVCNLILLRFEMRNQIVLHCGISGRECRSAIKTPFVHHLVSIRKKSLVSRDKVYFFTVTSSSIHKHSSFCLEAKNALGSDEHTSSLSSKKYSRYIYNTSYFPHIIRGMHPD